MDLLHEKRRALSHHPLVAAAMIGSAVVGGAISSSGAKSAANTQANAANAATQSQKEMFDKTVSLNAPYNQQGQAAASKLADLLGTTPGATPQTTPSSPGGFDGAAYLAANPDVAADPYFAQHPEEHYNEYGKSEGRQAPQLPAAGSPGQMAPATPRSADFGSLLKPFGTDDFHLDPGIQFQTQQGNQALMNSQAAKNGVLSGGALKDLIGYNQGMAGTGYQSAYDRYMANKSFTLGSLMDMSKMGQAAASGTTSAAPSFASGIAGTIQGAGQASASGTVGAANALSGAATSAGNSYFLNSLINGKSSSGGASTPDVGMAIPPQYNQA